MFAYKFGHVHMLQSGDEQQRVDFVNFHIIKYDEDDRWPLRITWTDEDHFCLIGKLLPRTAFIELTKTLTI